MGSILISAPRSKEKGQAQICRVGQSEGGGVGGIGGGESETGRRFIMCVLFPALTLSSVVIVPFLHMEQPVVCSSEVSISLSLTQHTQTTLSYKGSTLCAVVLPIAHRVKQWACWDVCLFLFYKVLAPLNIPNEYCIQWVKYIYIRLTQFMYGEAYLSKNFPLLLYS